MKQNDKMNAEFRGVITTERLRCDDCGSVADRFPSRARCSTKDNDSGLKVLQQKIINTITIVTYNTF